MRPRLSLALAILAMFFVAACGSQGYAPPLGKAVEVTVPATSGTGQATATFTPIHAMRVAVYYHGKLVPRTSAQTPAQVRSGGCTGPIVAALTDGTPSGSVYATPPPSGTPIIVQPADTGVYVSVAPSANLYVSVLTAPDDPTAPVVACGNPLSGRRQFFDLYPPDELGTGTSLGTALFDPVNVSRVDVSALGGDRSPVSWAVRTGSCDGATVAQGTFGAGATKATSVIFREIDPNWWVSVAWSGAATSCAQVK